MTIRHDNFTKQAQTFQVQYVFLLFADDHFAGGKRNARMKILVCAPVRLRAILTIFSCVSEQWQQVLQVKSFKLILMFILFQESFVKAAITKYRLLSSIPNIIGGRILETKNEQDSTFFVIGCSYTQRDIERNETRQYESFHNVKVEWQHLQTDISSFPFPAEKNNM